MGRGVGLLCDLRGNERFVSEGKYKYLFLCYLRSNEIFVLEGREVGLLWKGSINTLLPERFVLGGK